MSLSEARTGTRPCRSIAPKSQSHARAHVARQRCGLLVLERVRHRR